EDAPMVARLKAAGAIMVGKTNTPALGWLGATHNLLFGATRNPWRLDRTPGGSSGGVSAGVGGGPGGDAARVARRAPQPALRGDPQPVAPGPHPGWIERRRLRGGCGGPRADRDRDGWR